MLSSSPSSPSPSSSPAVDMVRLLGGFQISQALYVAARAGVADQLLDGPQPVARLAEATGTRPELLRRLIRTLAVDDVFTLDADSDTAALGSRGHTLATGHPESVRDLALMWMETHYAPFGALWDTLHDGTPAAEHTLGQPFFDWLGTDPQRVARFSGAMADLMRAVRKDALAAVDLKGVGTLVDIGGADGTALAELADSHPELRGTVFDLPHVVGAAGELLGRRGLADRIGVQGGDFFEAVPAGADAYLACFILHDWDDTRAARILARIHEAAAPGAQLLLVETVLGEGAQPEIGHLLDLTMLTMLGGRERSRQDWDALLTAAGFRLDAITLTDGPMCVIAATREP